MFFTFCNLGSIKTWSRKCFWDCSWTFTRHLEFISYKKKLIYRLFPSLTKSSQSCLFFDERKLNKTAELFINLCSVLEACQQIFPVVQPQLFVCEIGINRTLFCMHFSGKRNKKEQTLDVIDIFSLPIHKSSCRQATTWTVLVYAASYATKIANHFHWSFA